MQSLFAGWGAEIVSNLVLSAIVFACGLLVGKAREQRALRGRNLEEYEFYPFTVDETQQLSFNLALFMQGVDHFLHHRDHVAAQSWLANYVRIVNHLGESFRDLGIEILLHNLTNPARSLVALANNVTGRKIGDGATNLVLDLKRRRHRNEDKINYELVIGARRFKCTTVPIYRTDYGLIGALCVNIDANYLVEEVAPSPEKCTAFIREFCRTRMQLNENILSADEYQKALAGKRHWRDGVV